METKKCPHCSEEINSTAKICPICGELIDNETTTDIESEKGLAQSITNQNQSNKKEIQVQSETSIHNDAESTTSENTSETIEPFVEDAHFVSKKIKITYLSFAVVFFILCILTIKTPLQFYLGPFMDLDSMPYWLGFALLCLISLIAFFYSLGENRDGKIFLNENGELDTKTPRSYTALKKFWLARFLGRAHSFAGRGLSYFEYKDGQLYVKTNKGDSIQGPFEELTWKYSVDKKKGIYKYTLTNASGEKISFYKNDATFEDNEWDDINMLLSLCNKDESKTSKFTKKAGKVMDIIKSAADGDIIGAITDGVIGVTSSSKAVASSNPIIDKVYNRTYGEKKAKKKGKFKKILDWIISGFVILYIILILIVNILNLIEYWSSDSDHTNYDSYTESNAQITGVSLAGSINNEEPIEMDLSFTDRTGDGSYTNWEYYPVFFEIGDLKEISNGTYHLFLLQYQKGAITGYFDGTLRLSDSTYFGTYSSSLDGEKMSFKLYITKTF